MTMGIARTATPGRLKYLIVSNPTTFVAGGLFVLLVLLAVFGQFVITHDPMQTSVANALQPPSRSHFFGTDHLGRDVFSRSVIAARLDLSIALGAVLLSWAIGSAVGAVLGYWQGSTELVVGRLVDVLMAFPLFVLAMALVAALGNTVMNVVYATAIVNLPFYIRLSQAEVGRRRTAGYVQAAKLAGASDAEVLTRFLLPNIMPILVVQMSLNMGWAILNAAGLSFLGLGVRPPTAEWGLMIAEGAPLIISGEWWVALFPGLMLTLSVFCFNLLGDGLRDLMDPRRRS